MRRRRRLVDIDRPHRSHQRACGPFRGVLADSVWDDLDPGAKKPYVVTQVDIPVALSEATATGASPAAG